MFSVFLFPQEFVHLIWPVHVFTMFRRRRRQRALNAASGTAATSTAGTLSAATLSPRHATAARTRSTAWTPSAHAHDRPRRRTSWSPAAAAMVGDGVAFTHNPTSVVQMYRESYGESDDPLKMKKKKLAGEICSVICCVAAAPCLDDRKWVLWSAVVNRCTVQINELSYCNAAVKKLEVLDLIQNFSLFIIQILKYKESSLLTF